MKKIMLSIGSLAFAMTIQAASVNWGGTTEAAGFDSGWANEGAWYGVYLLSGQVGTSAISKYDIDTHALTISGATATLLDSHIVDESEYNNGVFESTFSGSAADFNGNYFAIVLFDESQNADYASSGIYTISGLDDAGQGKLMYIDGTGDATALAVTGIAGSFTTAAVSVPEPTSGLLMLLGMAGLALRRRRA